MKKDNEKIKKKTGSGPKRTKMSLRAFAKQRRGNLLNISLFLKMLPFVKGVTGDFSGLGGIRRLKGIFFSHLTSNVSRFSSTLYPLSLIRFKKAWKYIINQLSVRTVSILLVFVMVFNGIAIPLQFALLDPFQPEAAYADSTTWDFSGGTNGSGDANTDVSGGNVKLKQQWWDTNYAKRKKITISSNDAITSGYSAKSDIDLESLRSASTLQNDLDDARIVAENRSTGANTELDRDIIKGEGMSFDGSSQAMGVGSQTSLDDIPNSDFSVEAWINDEETAVSTWGTIFGAYVSGNGWSFRTLSDGTGNRSLYIQVPYSTTIATYQSNYGSITPGWHHVSAVWTASTKSAKLYIDGSEVTYIAQTAGSGTLNSDASTNKEIGRLPHVGGTQYFNGQIDEVRISNNARYTSNFTPQQTPYTLDSNTKGLWHLDGDAGDSSGNGNNGTLTGNPYYTEGKVVARGTEGMGSEISSTDSGLIANWKMNNDWTDSKGSNNGTPSGATFTTSSKLGSHAGQFNGTSDYVSNQNSLINPINAFTLSAWIKSPTGSAGSIYSEGRSSSTVNPFFRFYCSSSLIGISSRNDANSEISVFSNTASCSASTWHYVAFVNDGSENYTFYIDGVAYSETTDTMSGTYGNLDQLAIGALRRASNTENFFNGSIDELAVYNRALSQSEIKEQYNAKSETWFKTQSDISASSTSEASGSHSYYLYYDYASATNPPEDRINIYQFFDDFEDGSIDGSKWTTTGSVTESGGTLKITGSDSWNANGASSISFDRASGIALEWRSQVDAITGIDTFAGYSAQPLNYNSGVHLYRGGGGQLGRYLDGSGLVFTVPNGYGLSWVNAKIILKPTQGYALYWNDILKEDNTTWNGNNLREVFQIYNSGAVLEIDNAKVRPHVTLEPTSALGTQETNASAYASPGVWTSEEINPTGHYDWGTLTIGKTTPGASTLTVDVQRFSDSAVLATDVATGTDLSTVVSNTEKSIKLVANLGGGADTPILSALTLGYDFDTSAPTDPSGLSIDTVTSSSVDLSWTASTDAGGSLLAGYKIERAPDSGGNPGAFAQIDTSATNSYTDNSASGSTKYWYRVRAYDNAGNNSGYTDLGSYLYKKSITFNTTAQGANVATNQANFPVAVHINSSSWPTASERTNFFDASNAGGKRVTFYDSNESTVLDYEVEYYDQASKEAIYWVRVPQVDGNSSTDNIIVAYGNDPNGSDQDNKTGVWDTNFKAVYHMGDNAALNDSTSNNFNGTNNNTTDDVGYVRRGRNFDGIDNYVNDGDIDLTAVTLEMWFKPDSAASTEQLISKRGAGGWATENYGLAQYNSKVLYHDGRDSGVLASGTTTLVNGNWYYGASSSDTANTKVYTNGIKEFDGTGNRTGALPQNNDNVTVGALFNVGSRMQEYTGDMDEVRFSNSVRTDNWIKLTYYSTKKTSYNGDNGEGVSKFVTHGSEANLLATTTTLADVPVSPSATAASVSQINVSWASGGAQDHYHVKSSSDAYATNIYNSTGTSTSQSSLTSGTQYTYRIYGVNADNVENSTYASVSKYTLSDPPTLPVATDGTAAGGIDVSWTSSVTADHYHVYRDGVSGSGTLVHNASGTSFNDAQTGAHTYYIYSVNADDVENSSNISDSGSSDETAPTVPTNLSVGSVTASTVPLSWTASTDGGSGLAGYKVERAPDSGGSPGAFTQIGTPVTNSYSDTTASASTKYWYRVRAYDNASNNSGYTGEMEVDANVVGLWHLNEGTGGTTADASGNSNTGTLNIGATGTQTTNAQAWSNGANGKHGQALNFDGTDDYVSVADNDNFYFGSSDFTIETWIKIQGGTAAGIYAQGDVYSSFAIILNKSGSVWSMIYTGSTAGTAWDVSSGWVATSIAEGQWHHIAVTRNGSEWKGYVDGQNISTISSSVSLFNSTQDPYIGLYHGAGSDYRYFNGLIDEVRISNTARTGPQILNYYNESNPYPKGATTLANVPTSPSATATSVSQINVSWASGGNQDHYHVKSSSDAYATNIYNSTATSTSETSLSADTQYTYRIYGVNADDAESSSYASASKYTLANVPGAPTASNATATSLDVVIDTNSNPANTTYAIYNNTATQYVQADGTLGAGAVYQTYAAWGGVTGITNTSLNSSTSYTYKVEAKNGDNTLTAFSANSTPVSTLADVPSAPTIGVPSALSTTSIRWNFTDNASNETGFRIHNASHSIMASDATANIGYVDEASLTANTQYIRHAHAYNGAGDSTGSATASKYTLSVAPNVTVDKTASTWYNTTDVIFTNAASFGAAGVQYYRYVFDQNATHTWTDAETQWLSSTLTRTASANGSWYLHVKSFNGDDVANGEQTYGPFYYDGSAPSDPSGLGLTAASVSQIDLSWTGSTDSGGSNLIGYKLERAPDSGGSPGSFSQIDTDTASPYSNTSLIANTKYWYKVRAYDGASNNSGYTTNASKVTLSDPPTLPVATDGTLVDQVGVSWTASVTADHYHVYKDGVAGSGTLIYNSAGTSATDTVLDNSTHTYYIYAVNSEDANSATYISDTGYRMASPSAPTPGAVTALSTTSLRHNFTDNSSNETGFKVHDMAHSTVAIDATPNISYVDETGLSANTQYSRHIHAYNGAGDSLATAISERYTLSVAPNVTADKTTSTWYSTTDVIFTNTAGFGASGVQYYRYVFDQNATHTFTDAETQWSASTLTRTASANGSWYIHVKSFNGNNIANGEQTYGPFYYDGSAPSDPSGLNATAVSTSQIDLSWTASTDTGGSNLAGYKIERAPDSGGSPGTFVQIDTSATNLYSDTSLSANTTYWYRVRSYDNAGNNSGYTTNTSETTLANTPSASTIGAATVLSPTSISWAFTDNASNETGFKLHDASHNTVATVSSANADSITETGLTANTQYTRHVHAYNGAGDSGASTSVSKYTLAALPSVSTGFNTGDWYANSAIIFSSNRALGAGGVSYYRYSFNNSANSLVTTFNTQWSSGDLTLPISSSGIYYLHIKAYNADDVETSQLRYGPYHFDLEAPKVKIISHTSGDYVKGEITLEAQVSDNIGLTDIGFYDNSLSNRISTTSKASFDTRKVSNGSRAIYAQVKDGAGNVAANIITINVDNIKPKAPSPENKDKGQIKEVKKGQIVRVYFKVKETTSDNRSTVKTKIHRRINRRNYKQRLHRVLKVIARRRVLRRIYHRTKHKKDRKSRIRTRLLKRQIISFNRQVRKYYPYKLRYIKTATKRVSSNKRVYVTYTPRKRGLFRIAIRVYDKANNISKPLVKWIRVR